MRIIPRHLSLAIANDDELMRLFPCVTIARGGIRPHIHDVLLPIQRRKLLAASKDTPTAVDKQHSTEF